MDDLELEIKQLIVSTLNLEGIQPQDIGAEEPLFGDGLALDSIDGLELGMALRKVYGLKFETANDEVRQHFATVRSLARFVAANRSDT
jgi:acyl carrier protein